MAESFVTKSKISAPLRLFQSVLFVYFTANVASLSLLAMTNKKVLLGVLL
jgi:hypothetical protein